MTHQEEDVAVLDIREGGLVKYLLRPFSYYWMIFLDELGWRVLQGFMALAALLLLSVFFKTFASLASSLEILFLGLIIFILGYFISFTFKMILGLSAFWVTDFWGLQQLTEVTVIVLAGFVMPVDLFPTVVRQIAFLTPFPYMVYYPLVAIQGKLFAFQLVQVIAVQLVWLTILALAYRYMWSTGVRKFTGVGQ